MNGFDSSAIYLVKFGFNKINKVKVMPGSLIIFLLCLQMKLW